MAIQENVARLEVAMEHTFFVRVVHGAGDFGGWERSPLPSFIFRLFLAPCYGTPAKDWTLICSLPG